MNTPEGQTLFRRLVAIGDVVTENFSAHTMEKWGFGYPQLRAIKPDIIYVQMSGMGHTGPEHNYVSYGPTAQALSGLSYQSGLPEPAPPAGWGYSYLDHSGAYYGAMAVLCGLLHRQQTGAGQHIDVAQEAVGLVLTGTALLEAVVNGRPTVRTGNRSPYRPAAPHGVYACQGEDRWCAIAEFSEPEWQALCTAVHHPVDDQASVHPGKSLQHQDDLDADLSSWTRQHTAEEVMQRLQAHGVRAGVVQTAADKIRHDPQLRARQFLVEVPHSRFGPLPVETTPLRFSATPVHPGGPIQRGAPRWGEDNSYVYGELLGLSEEEIADYAAKGINVRTPMLPGLYRSPGAGVADEKAAHCGDCWRPRGRGHQIEATWGDPVSLTAHSWATARWSAACTPGATTSTSGVTLDLRTPGEGCFSSWSWADGGGCTPIDFLGIPPALRGLHQLNGRCSGLSDTFGGRSVSTLKASDLITWLRRRITCVAMIPLPIGTMIHTHRAADGTPIILPRTTPS
jgi:crotonobetainyl-CoA:carnitine CoA-transferase CaiB-like acyl-CoA transferase